MGAATASNGAVGLFHVENLTPDAVELGNSLLREDYKTYVIDDAEMERVKNGYPVMWENENAKPERCFIGCPHLSFNQIKGWTDRIEEGLKEHREERGLVFEPFLPQLRRLSINSKKIQFYTKDCWQPVLVSALYVL